MWICLFLLFSFFSFCFTYFLALAFGEYIQDFYLLLVDKPFYHYIMSLSVPDNFLCNFI